MQFLNCCHRRFSCDMLTYFLIVILTISTVRSESCLLPNVSYTICSSTTSFAPESKSFTKDELFQECPASFIEKILGESCHTSSVQPTKSNIMTTAKSYIYALAAVLIISGLSLLGLLIFPLIYKVSVEYVLSLFTALAVGTLFGDTMFHLIPFALGVHSDSQHGKHAHSFFSAPDYTWKMLISVSILYLFYLLETILHAYSHSKYKHTNVVHLNHAVTDHEPSQFNEELSEFVPMKTDMQLESTHHIHEHTHPNFHRTVSDGSNKISTPDQVNDGLRSNTSVSSCQPCAHLHANLPNSSIISHGFKKTSKKTRYEPVPIVNNDLNEKDESSNANPFIQHSEKVTSTGWLVLVGDTIHNFADGLAMGAAFRQDLLLGITTTFAIGLHELPHEFGDYAVLRRSGFSHKRAVLLNCLSASTAVIGCLIGVALSSNEHVRQWIFSVTIGMFMYIALVDLLPHLLADNQTDLKGFIIVNVGIIMGFFIMFLLALFEDGLIRSSS